MNRNNTVIKRFFILSAALGLALSACDSDSPVAPSGGKSSSSVADSENSSSSGLEASSSSAADAGELSSSSESAPSSSASSSSQSQLLSSSSDTPASSSSVDVPVSSSSEVAASSSSASSSSGVVYGALVDVRDGRQYKTVTIEGREWMAENLKYLPQVNKKSDQALNDARYYVYDYDGVSLSGAKDTESFKKYGALYNWTAADAACPSGWHLPTFREWNLLVDAAEGKNSAGQKLKAVWPSSGSYEVVGTDDFGFALLPGGFYEVNYNGEAWFIYWMEQNKEGWWWSSSENGGAANAFKVDLSSNADADSQEAKRNGYSVRCIKDED